MTIRPATPDDLEVIERIQQASPEAVRWPAADYLAYRCDVAVLEGRPAGFLVTRALGGGEYEVLNLAVDPAMRRRGVARALLAAVLAASPGGWFLEVRESNAGARAFYSGLGFKAVAFRPKYYKDSGEGAVVMALEPC